ncbi:hypothetical protein NPIL_401921 [Nephila pilipes]|uniref:Uncharacterized protein n=1 Tax=Nephila pilipes TaxID=299642 RepID=A0A8X6N8Y1_NEPPI|nr:hypothetical protein NPIL_401921 [Nephila pilipes]
MNTFEKLKAKRSVFRGRLTKFMAKTESILDSSVEDTDSDELLELLEHINKKENDLNIVNSEIEIAITDPTVFDNEFKISEEYSDKITIIKFRIKNRIQKINALDNSVVEKRESRPAQFACLKLPKTHPNFSVYLDGPLKNSLQVTCAPPAALCPSLVLCKADS